MRFTSYGWSLCLWLLLVSFQYGYHISVLNQVKAVLTCHPLSTICIPMSNFTFGVVTSVFTIGGLVGSLCANHVMDSYGRLAAARFSAVLVGLGALVMSTSMAVSPLILGRFLTGVGSGVGLCLVPVYLSEISPPTIKGNLGVLTQLSIVLGIFVTQSIGLRFATPTQWRHVLLFSFAIAVIQLLTSVFMVDSPAWLKARGQELITRKKLWVDPPKDVEVRDPLLPVDEHQARDDETHPAPAITVPQLLKVSELRKPLLMISIVMISQQASGVNAVLYYSNDILSKTLPELGPYISLAITVVNVIMTFPTVFLIERTGRRKLLQLSTLGAVVSLISVGIGIDMGFVVLSSIAILTFIMSFAFGLGPVPFVLIPEISPIHAVSSMSSFALSVNWITNFLVGLVFIPLRHLLAGDDPRKEGRVFYVFAIVLAAGMVWFSRMYR